MNLRDRYRQAPVRTTLAVIVLLVAFVALLEAMTGFTDGLVAGFTNGR